jgi:hypothetical protein
VISCIIACPPIGTKATIRKARPAVLVERRPELRTAPATADTVHRSCGSWMPKPPAIVKGRSGHRPSRVPALPIPRRPCGSRKVRSPPSPGPRRLGRSRAGFQRTQRRCHGLLFDAAANPNDHTVDLDLDHSRSGLSLVPGAFWLWSRRLPVPPSTDQSPVLAGCGANATLRNRERQTSQISWTMSC